jgi:hypothetical protein
MQLCKIDVGVGANKVHHLVDDKTNSRVSAFDISAGEVIRKLGYQHKQVTGFFFKNRINVNKL